MKERPILFSAPMVRAILDGTKTQTRRVCKGQRELSNIHDFRLDSCPHGQPGGRLWVRETFALESCVEHDQEPPFSDGRPTRSCEDPDPEYPSPRWIQAHYRATDPAPDLCCESTACRQCRDHDMGPHWRPSIFMPRWASRITLEVIGVRVERLQAISHSDAIAEGVQRIVIGDGYDDRYSATARTRADAIEQHPDVQASAVAAYRELWESINGMGSWLANPWVWVVEFKRIAP